MLHGMDEMSNAYFHYIWIVLFAGSYILKLSIRLFISNQRIKCNSFILRFFSDWNDLTMAPGGKKGIFGGNKDNRIESPIAIADKYEDVMQSFKEFVRMNLVNSGIESDSIGFIEKL